MFLATQVDRDRRLEAWIGRTEHGVDAKMTEPQDNTRKPWIEPKITELELRETYAFGFRGADVGGNPAIDSQRS